MRLAAALMAVPLVVLCACGGESGGDDSVDAEVGRFGGRDGGSVDTGDVGDDSLAPDVIVDDGFTRPPRPDAAATDAGDADAAPLSDAPADATDAGAEPGDAPSDIAVDAPPSPDVSTTRIFTGEADCFRWTIEAEQLVFDFKVDDFLVSYLVENICAEDLTFRVDHFNDFFSLAIHRDGELWTYLGVCPGEGPAQEWTFHAFRGGLAEGVRRAWRWSADQHETLLAACGVEFDEDASYALVGYANRPLEGSATRSEQYLLTDEIPLTINP